MQGDPINKWVNLFKPTATEQNKENYAGRIRMKIAATNTDRKHLLEIINDPKYLFKTKLSTKKQILNKTVRIDSKKLMEI